MISSSGWCQDETDLSHGAGGLVAVGTKTEIEPLPQQLLLDSSSSNNSGIIKVGAQMTSGTATNADSMDNDRDSRRYFVNLEDLDPNFPPPPTTKRSPPTIDGGALFIRSTSPVNEHHSACPAIVKNKVEQTDSSIMTNSGQYFLEMRRDILGEGRFCRVYAAWLREVSSDKVIESVAKAYKREDMTTALQECEILQKLRGVPGIVQLYDYVLMGGDSEFSLILVLERAMGGNLSQWVFSPLQSGFTFDFVYNCARDLFASLAEIHNHGIIHWDVKPHNLLLHGDRLILSDFGSATVGHVTTRPMGTIAYTPPEALALKEPEVLSPSVDIYSAGIVLYSLISGRPPFASFESQTGVSLILAIRTGFFRGPNNPTEGISPKFSSFISICEACLQLDPTIRPTAGQVLHRLEQIGRPS